MENPAERGESGLMPAYFHPTGRTLKALDDTILSGGWGRLPLWLVDKAASLLNQTLCRTKPLSR